MSTCMYIESGEAGGVWERMGKHGGGVDKQKTIMDYVNDMGTKCEQVSKLRMIV